MDFGADAAPGTANPRLLARRDVKSKKQTRRDPKRVRTEERTPTRVLIVEDDWLIATESEAILTRAGYEVVGLAADEAAAYALVERTQPDLVLMDVQLARGGDGVTLAAALRKQYGLRSVFVTAHGDAETRLRGEIAKPRGWLIKPFTDRQLVGAVERALAAEN